MQVCIQSLQSSKGVWGTELGNVSADEDSDRGDKFSSKRDAEGKLSMYIDCFLDACTGNVQFLQQMHPHPSSHTLHPPLLHWSSLNISLFEGSAHDRKKNQSHPQIKQETKADSETLTSTIRQRVSDRGKNMSLSVVRSRRMARQSSLKYET